MASKARRGPGRPPASEAPPDRSRRLLLDAAARVFAERGFRGASVERIVKQAGLSKGAFYWHFSSKDELFSALVEERIDRPAEALMEITRKAPAEAASAPQVSAGLATLLKEERELLLLANEYWAAAVRDKKLRSRYVKRQERLRTSLARALEVRSATTGMPLIVQPEQLATAFIALAEGLAFQALIDPSSVDEGLYGEILSLVYDGTAARAKRS